MMNQCFQKPYAEPFPTSSLGCAVIIGYNFGLPLSHLLLARQLEALTSLRTRSVLYDVSLKRRNKIVDVGLSLVVPILGILVHLTQMDRRYWIAEGFGAMPSTYWDAWGVTWMAIVPIVIAVGALIYTGEYYCLRPIVSPELIKLRSYQ
jgi:pheromone a factor receptor